MKKDFLTGLKISDDVADQIMAENGKDIEREKSKYSDRDELKTQLAETKSQLEKLKAMKPEELNQKISDLTAQLTKTQQESAAKIAQMETTAKVKDYLAGKKFVNDITRDAIASKLAEALGSDESKGKSLDDLFTGLTKDQKNILVDDNAPKPPVQTAMSAAPQGAQDGVEAAFAKLNPTIKI
jgi:hypothetical protein